ncbi:uncharacterized protein DNG_05782 [Cephalotrichum gorgonifer]|uniref:NAD(P)-binding domain-containing protein n=1 Tax=Cephalotrichum gorgonifer TaxID=2041049 RepID=A0AAE8N1E7_9PEZI|nr:uncharacterized protein DNG_05782 [Cephalotrichum gorgonifer]
METIAFLGATGGCGLAALARSLTASHPCVALCRNPSRLTTSLAALYPSAPTANLTIIEGNAHDASAVSRVVASPTDPTRLVDIVIFSIGNRPELKTMVNMDPTVCERGMTTLLSVLDDKVKSTTGSVAARHPHIVALSSTGVGAHGRDYPVLLTPVYMMLHTPHVDKRRMEDTLKASRAGPWTIVRPSLLKDGDLQGEAAKGKGKDIRVGVEDLVKDEVVSREVGYFITRDDVGKWIYENIVAGTSRGEYDGKAVSLTN